MTADSSYDVFGNRVEKVVDDDRDEPSSPVTMRFAIDGWNPAKPSPVGNENYDVWADLYGDNSLKTRYDRGDNVDEVKARVDSIESVLSTNWLLTDHLGSVRDVIGNTGTPVDSLKYDGFGNIDDATELDPEYRGRYTWTGREFDVEIELQFNRARYYDAVTGRWISQDPLGFDAGDSNLYRYVNNAPTNATDPSGLYETDVHYYMTYYIAALMGFDRIRDLQSDATLDVLIAWANENTDRHPDTQPITKDESVQRIFHFSAASGEKVKRSSVYAESNLLDAIRKGDVLEFGIALHAYQDSWSHEKFSAGIGHALEPFGGHEPDYPWHNVGKAMEMARATCKYLSAFYRRVNPGQNPKIAYEQLTTTLKENFETKGDPEFLNRYANNALNQPWTTFFLSYAFNASFELETVGRNKQWIRTSKRSGHFALSPVFSDSEMPNKFLKRVEGRFKDALMKLKDPDRFPV